MAIPDKKMVEDTVNGLFDAFFTIEDDLVEFDIKKKESKIKVLLYVMLDGLSKHKEKLIDEFVESAPGIRKKLIDDAEFILNGDPAAKSLVEVIAIYPGFFAIFCYRIAHFFYQKHIQLLPRMVTEYAHRTTGIDIHPGARIGSPFSIDHGTGIVIGETTIIGNHVKLYQGVTLGALSVDKSKASKKRHPTIENDVILYSGCTILGGSTVVGRNSIIGGNVWLTESINPFSIVYNKSEIIVRDRGKYQQPVNFVI